MANTPIIIFTFIDLFLSRSTISSLEEQLIRIPSLISFFSRVSWFPVGQQCLRSSLQWHA